METIDVKNRKKIVAKKLKDQLQVTKKWKEETFEVNANWLKNYIQPLLDELYLIDKI